MGTLGKHDLGVRRWGDNRPLTRYYVELAARYGSIDGGHHKMWVIDQMVRALTGCPMIEQTMTHKEQIYIYEVQGESPEYLRLIADAKFGEDGPDTYEWDTGIAP